MGRTPCSLLGRPRARLVGTRALETAWRVVPARSPSPDLSAIYDPPSSLRALAPGRAVWVPLRWSNWCPPRTSETSTGPPPDALVLVLPHRRGKAPVVGSARDAQWLSPGGLVVAGWDAAHDSGGEIVFEPSGLRLLETTGWTDRTVHPRAMLFYVRPPRLLTIAPGEPDCAAPMLTAYTLAGAEAYRVCDDRATGALEFASRYARLGRIDGRVAVIDLDTGALVARVREVNVNPLEPLETALIH